MARELLRLSETPLHEEKTWERGGVTVLRAEVTLPQCQGRDRRACRLNRYYRQYARAYLGYCAAELFPRAAESMEAAAARSAPWQCARAALTCTQIFAHGAFLSLCTEGREEGIAPHLVLRRAETWDMGTGYLLPLAAFFPPKTPVRPLLIRSARAQAAERLRAGTAVFYPNYRSALRRAFSARSFYLAEDGLHWFYPMYTAASAAEGIPDFCLPYCEAGPFLPAQIEAAEKKKRGPKAALFDEGER